MTINLTPPDVRELKPRITVFGVGGAGGNAVNNMITAGLEGVDFVVANTDAQALSMTKAQRIIQMGTEVTQGLGAGSQPDVGAAAAQEVIDEIRDHLSGAQHIRHHLGGKVAIGAHIRAVPQLFRSVFHFERSFLPDGSQFDHLFEDGETFHVGGLELTALHVPGHTPADMAYRVGDDVFVGDTLFMPDVGTARADFPGGDAATLYRSIQRLLALPAHTRLHMCHDYPPENRAPAWVSTVAEQRSGNIHVHEGVTEAAFVQMRTARDATLAMPTLILPSVQVNVRAGKLPPAQDDGRTYIQLPINAFLKGAGAPQGMS